MTPPLADTGFIDAAWTAALPTLQDYIAVPARSPMFDPAWEANGHLGRAARMLRDWAASRGIPGMRVELLEPHGLTPLLLVEIDATDAALAAHTVVLYGHLDKQPEMEPWSPGLGPWLPVLRGDRLYGRGGADDGYSIFAALIAIRFLLRFVSQHSFAVFAWYRIVFGGVILLTWQMGWVQW